VTGSSNSEPWARSALAKRGGEKPLFAWFI
jgi:hypothetical protein